MHRINNKPETNNISTLDGIPNRTSLGRFGVNRDLSYEPSALIMLLDKPVAIANHENKSLEMQIYGFDKTMAPQGKGVIKEICKKDGRKFLTT